ncbi:MAG: L-rhamnose mutarotase [Spirochaetales bacterium]|nr:L-rhamnose mutarotase [Spirochaetales bacterium]
MRNAFKMKLYPGFAEEYKKRHDEIWPELKSLLEESGIKDYSIFLDEETNILFAINKSDDGREPVDLAQEEIVKKWWAFMADIMETNPDNSPVVINLKEVFHMD